MCRRMREKESDEQLRRERGFCMDRATDRGKIEDAI